MKRYVHVLLLLATSAMAATPEMPRFQWQNFTAANGLPDDHVFCVLVDGNRIWAGTENGIGIYDNGTWKVLRTATGMAHRVVLSLAPDKRTSDV